MQLWYLIMNMDEIKQIISDAFEREREAKERMKERQLLETMQSVCDWKYSQTQDEFYKKISNQISKKLKGGKNDVPISE